MPDEPLAYSEIDVKRSTRLKGLFACRALGSLSLQCVQSGSCPYIYYVVILTLYSDLSRIQIRATVSRSDLSWHPAAPGTSEKHP